MFGQRQSTAFAHAPCCPLRRSTAAGDLTAAVLYLHHLLRDGRRPGGLRWRPPPASVFSVLAAATAAVRRAGDAAWWPRRTRMSRRQPRRFFAENVLRASCLNLPLLRRDRVLASTGPTDPLLPADLRLHALPSYRTAGSCRCWVGDLPRWPIVLGARQHRGGRAAIPRSGVVRPRDRACCRNSGDHDAVDQLWNARGLG